MTDVQQRAAARQFAADWKDRGDEKQETQAFWLALLQKVFGVEEPEKYISFERRVEVDDPARGSTPPNSSTATSPRPGCWWSRRAGTSC